MKQVRIVLFSLLLTAATTTVVGADSGYASRGMADASPSEVYLRYVDVLNQLTSLKQLLPFSNRKRATNLEQLSSMSTEQRQKTIKMLRAGAPKDVTVAKEQIQDSSATLTVTGKMLGVLEGDMQPVWGTITLVRKAGEWKMKYSDWSDKQTPE